MMLSAPFFALSALGGLTLTFSALEKVVERLCETINHLT